jgi:hypothetical protein
VNTFPRLADGEEEGRVFNVLIMARHSEDGKEGNTFCRKEVGFITEEEWESRKPRKEMIRLR